MKKILVFLITIFIAFLVTPNVYAKYVLNQKYEVINIKKADTDKPYINNRNYDIDYESFNSDVTINYFDNLKIKYAKYWFNEKEKAFNGDGIEFNSGTSFSKSGFYKIEVSDMYENKTTYYFVIDKEVNYADLEIQNLNDNGGSLIINAEDFVSGIQKIELYINNSVYKSYAYNEEFIKNKTEEIYVDIDNLPFYEEAYIRVTDCYGNTLESSKIIPNKNRIYDLQDLVKFKTVINTGVTNFSGQGIYLLNDINLSNVCSISKGSWTPIGTNGRNFSGVFEGNNHTISNLYIDSSTSYSGLFRTVSGTIQNLNINGTIANAGGNSGAFVGSLSKRRNKKL